MAAIAALFLWPALVNGWPLVFHDSGGYLERAFLMNLDFGRSLYYGLFLRAFVWGDWGLWPALFAQGAITVLTLTLTWRVLAEGRHGDPDLMGFGVLGAVLALGSGLPFFVAQVMPDALMAPMVLALHLLAFHRRRLSAGERAAMAAVVVLGCLVHMSHLALALGLGAAMGVASAVRVLRPDFGRWLGDLAPGLPLAAILGALVILPIGNGLIGGRFGPTPGGAVYLLGRLVQDGMAAKVLAEVCPDPRFKLCAFKDDLPDNANDFLWGGDEAALRQVGGLEGAEPEARALILESLRRHPIENAVLFLRAAFDQFFLRRTGDELGAFMWHTPWRVHTLLPDQAAAFDAARQQRRDPDDQHALAALSAVHGVILWTGLGLAVIGLGRANDPARLFTLFVLLALVGNAVICGALSNPQGRYQDKLLWLALVAAYLTWRRPRGAHAI